MPKKILLVDDEANIRKVLSVRLKNAGYEIVGEAYDGDEAMELYRLTKPDLVLLDIAMPRFDGITGLKKILEFDPAANVVMVTALSEKKTIVKSIRAGAKDYLQKPFKTEELLEMIEKIIGK